MESRQPDVIFINTSIHQSQISPHTRSDSFLCWNNRFGRRAPDTEGAEPTSSFESNDVGRDAWVCVRIPDASGIHRSRTHGGPTRQRPRGGNQRGNDAWGMMRFPRVREIANASGIHASVMRGECVPDALGATTRGECVGNASGTHRFTFVELRDVLYIALSCIIILFLDPHHCQDQ